MVRFFRLFLIAAGLSCLAACTRPARDAAVSSWLAARPAEQGFRFDWQLSGDPAVAPMQVFDDGRETWLHFAPGQPLPAIFGVGLDGERALPYSRRDPYVVLNGAWTSLSFRGGRLAARAQRAQAMPAPLAQPVETAPVSAAPEAALASAQPMDKAGAGAKPQQPQEPAARYRAGPPDATLRAVLARWAGSAGWTFQPQHWAVDVDIPLSATAEFSGDFKSAVRQLLGATELAEKPLQPCFYGNKVLRVVPLAQSCTRAAAPGGAAA